VFLKQRNQIIPKKRKLIEYNREKSAARGLSKNGFLLIYNLGGNDSVCFV
jgi:hypothetical protein